MAVLFMSGGLVASHADGLSPRLGLVLRFDSSPPLPASHKTGWIQRNRVPSIVANSCPECGTVLLENLVRELEEESGLATLEAAYHTECHKCGARLRRRQGHEWKMWGPPVVRQALTL
jgi:hypothetical protein